MVCAACFRILKPAEVFVLVNESSFLQIRRTIAMAEESVTPISGRPMELSIPLPKHPHTILHLHLTFLTTSIMLFLTTSTIGDSSSVLSPLGSFVYAMPDVCRSAAWSASLPLINSENPSNQRHSYCPLHVRIQHRLCHPDSKDFGSEAATPRLCWL
jgi:Proteasome assembly chaperone 4